MPFLLPPRLLKFGTGSRVGRLLSKSILHPRLGRVLIKRDDLTGFVSEGRSGVRARKLEGGRTSAKLRDQMGVLTMPVGLFDPTTMADSDWPAGSEAVRAFVEAICQHGPERFISNVRTRMMVLREGDMMLPVTINDTEYENSIVCSFLAVTRYFKDELKLIDSPFIRGVLAPILDGAGAIVRLARLNKVVQVNNWLVHTNPYPPNWSPNLASITGALVLAFPDHAICFRSLNEWANPGMLERLKAYGYKLIAYLPVYVFDRWPETHLVRRDVKRDQRLLRHTTYRTVLDNKFDEADYPRMAELYQMLNCRHSKFNAAVTPD